MALPTIQPSDFKGSLKIVQGSAYSILDEYINQFYTEINTSWLKKIVGRSAFELIENTDPLPDQYLDLFNGVGFLNTRTNQTEEFEGLTEAFKRLIYFEYQRDYFKSSQTGMINVSNENSISATILKQNGYSISAFNTASEYVSKGLNFVCEYTNQPREILNIVDIGAGQIRIETSNTKYLTDGNAVRINSTEYVVSSVIENTSFIIDSALIESDTYYYDSFPEIQKHGEVTNYSPLGTIVG